MVLFVCPQVPREIGSFISFHLNLIRASGTPVQLPMRIAIPGSHRAQLRPWCNWEVPDSLSSRLLFSNAGNNHLISQMSVFSNGELNK
jgi:hypothetical protein